MKLAAIYNIFDGEELLEKSILSIRDNVDIIIAVVQKISNWGHRYESGAIECERLEQMKLIDVVIHYEPTEHKSVGFAPWLREQSKRWVGVQKAMALGCTHVFHIDTDEFYKKEEFSKAREFLENNPEYDSSACRLKLYFKKPTWSLGLDSKCWVPFIHKVDENTYTTMESCKEFPVPVDPTRSLSPNKKIYIFPEDRLLMYHYSWVRKDIARKWINSSSRFLFELEGVIAAYYTAQVGSKIGYWHQTIEEDDDYFHISCFSDEPQKTPLLVQCSTASDVVRMYCIGADGVAIVDNKSSSLIDAVLDGLSLAMWQGKKIVYLPHRNQIPRLFLRGTMDRCKRLGIDFSNSMTTFTSPVHTLIIAGSVCKDTIDRVLATESDRVLHYVLVVESKDKKESESIRDFLSSSTSWKQHQCIHDVTVLRRIK